MLDGVRFIRKGAWDCGLWRFMIQYLLSGTGDYRRVSEVEFTTWTAIEGTRMSRSPGLYYSK